MSKSLCSAVVLIYLNEEVLLLHSSFSHQQFFFLSIALVLSPHFIFKSLFLARHTFSLLFLCVYVFEGCWNHPLLQMFKTTLSWIPWNHLIRPYNWSSSFYITSRGWKPDPFLGFNPTSWPDFWVETGWVWPSDPSKGLKWVELVFRDSRVEFYQV